MLFLKQTVAEGFASLHFRRGNFVNILKPGPYRHLSSDHQIVHVDLRPTINVSGRVELDTLDGSAIRISLQVEKQVVDPKKF